MCTGGAPWGTRPRAAAWRGGGARLASHPLSRASLTPPPPCSDDCGWELYQEINGKVFMPIPKCVSAQCLSNQNVGRINMMVRPAGE